MSDDPRRRPGARAAPPRRLLRPARRLAALLARVRWVALRVLGAPDYERYVQALWRRSPGALPLSRERFEQERVEARHQRIGGRCC